MAVVLLMVSWVVRVMEVVVNGGGDDWCGVGDHRGHSTTLNNIVHCGDAAVNYFKLRLIKTIE